MPESAEAQFFTYIQASTPIEHEKAVPADRLFVCVDFRRVASDPGIVPI